MHAPRRVDTHKGVRAVAAAACVCSCAALAADYGIIAEQNLFDPQRKPWSERSAPDPVSPLSADELQVEGVVVHGGLRRAIVGLGGKLRALAPGGAAGRSSVILREGQALGAYTLESIGLQQLVFVSGGKRFAVPFIRTARRVVASAPAALPVIQSPTLPVAAPPAAPRAQSATSTAPRPFGQPAAPTPAPAPAQGAPAQPAPARPAATAAAPASGGMTLLQAIQAAEAARRAGKTPSAPPYNPFAPRSP